MKTVLINVKQAIIPQDWKVETYKDDNHNDVSYLTSIPTLVLGDRTYQGSTSTVYGMYEDAAEMEAAHDIAIHIHDVTVEDIGRVCEWASKTFYAQGMDVMF